MHAFDVLGDPVRRRILELLAQEEMKSGGVVEVIQSEFGITQAAVSQHLKVLKDAGFAQARVNGAQRIYSIVPGRFAEVDEWLGQFRKFWLARMDALGAEIERGKDERR